MLKYIISIFVASTAFANVTDLCTELAPNLSAGVKPIVKIGNWRGSLTESVAFKFRAEITAASNLVINIEECRTDDVATCAPLASFPTITTSGITNLSLNRHTVHTFSNLRINVTGSGTGKVFLCRD